MKLKKELALHYFLSILLTIGMIYKTDMCNLFFIGLICSVINFFEVLKKL